MLESFFNALSGLRTSSRRMQTSAHNVANVQTPGFKSGRVTVAEVATGGARVEGILRTDTPGAILPTLNPLDLAIDGAGFFQVRLDGGGLGFTRAGALHTDNAGRLVTSSGNPLVPEITVPGNATGVFADSSGVVSAHIGGQTQTLGQIQLATFAQPGGLTALGGNRFAESAASGPPLAGTPGTGGIGRIVPGGLETSNVDLAREVIDQILAKQAFRANANVIRTADQMLGTLLDIQS